MLLISFYLRHFKSVAFQIFSVKIINIDLFFIANWDNEVRSKCWRLYTLHDVNMPNYYQSNIPFLMQRSKILWYLLALQEIGILKCGFYFSQFRSIQKFWKNSCHHFKCGATININVGKWNILQHRLPPMIIKMILTNYLFHLWGFDWQNWPSGSKLSLNTWEINIIWFTIFCRLCATLALLFTIYRWQYWNTLPGFEFMYIWSGCAEREWCFS